MKKKLVVLLAAVMLFASTTTVLAAPNVDSRIEKRKYKGGGTPHRKRCEVPYGS